MYEHRKDRPVLNNHISNYNIVPGVWTTTAWRSKCTLHSCFTKTHPCAHSDIRHEKKYTRCILQGS